jgi:hypothetical protein
MPFLSTLFEEQEDPSISNSYINDTLSEPIPNPEPISQEKVKVVSYYSHPKFTPMERNLHKTQCNLPENLTDPFEIFQLFFFKKLIESFAKYTNEYTKREIKRRQKKGPERLLKYKK